MRPSHMKANIKTNLVSTASLALSTSFRHHFRLRSHLIDQTLMLFLFFPLPSSSSYLHVCLPFLTLIHTKIGVLLESHRNPPRFCRGLEQPRMRVQRPRRDLARHPSLRESRGLGSQFLGRIHQPRQCPQGGPHLRSVSWIFSLIYSITNFDLEPALVTTSLKCRNVTRISIVVF